MVKELIFLPISTNYLFRKRRFIKIENLLFMVICGQGNYIISVSQLHLHTHKEIIKKRQIS